MSSLARRLLNNPGLIALTVLDEQNEIAIVTKTAKGMRSRIKFAFFQKTLDGGKIPYWHVNWKSPSDFGTTLAIEGLRQQGYIR